MAPNTFRLAAIGNYQLSPLVLGKGSFSRVVLAHHVLLKKEVALKVITLSEIEDPYVKKNLWREVQVMLKLNHPNVVSLHEVCSYENFFCLVMDLYPGGSLCDLLEEHLDGKLEEARSKSFLSQLATGLKYIHSKGIIHRDIKLENIYLDKNKAIAYIGDFGLSNFWAPGMQLKTRCGSAEYAAPELFNRELDYDHAVDVWSLGVLIYALLTGTLPFTVEGGENKVKQLVAVINAGLTEEHLAQLGHLSEDCKLAVSNMLEVDRAKRISLKELEEHPWLMDVEKVVQENKKSLSLEQQLMVATKVQKRLNLDRLKPEEILRYVMSSKGRCGKTAGCFSLLGKELIENEGGKTEEKKDEAGSKEVFNEVETQRKALATVDNIIGNERNVTKNGERCQLWMRGKSGKQGEKAGRLKRIESDDLPLKKRIR